MNQEMSDVERCMLMLKLNIETLKFVEVFVEALTSKVIGS